MLVLAWCCVLLGTTQSGNESPTPSVTQARVAEVYIRVHTHNGVSHESQDLAPQASLACKFACGSTTADDPNCYSVFLWSYLTVQSNLVEKVLLSQRFASEALLPPAT